MLRVLHRFPIGFMSLNVWYIGHLKFLIIGTHKKKFNLTKDAYPRFLSNKFIKKCLDYNFSSNQNQAKDKFDVQCFKLPYISNLSHYIKNKFSKLCKEFWERKLTLS